MKNSAILFLCTFILIDFFVLIEYSFFQKIFLFALEGLYEFISKFNIVGLTLALLMVRVFWDVTL